MIMTSKKQRKSVSGVIVYAEDTKKMLLLGDHEERWGIPAGKRRSNETPKVAALRELRQETGLRDRNISYLTTSTTGGKPMAWFLLLEEIKPKIVLSTEHNRKKWVDPKNIPKRIADALINPKDIDLLLNFLHQRNCDQACCA